MHMYGSIQIYEPYTSCTKIMRFVIVALVTLGGADEVHKCYKKGTFKQTYYSIIITGTK